jgi:hypothetical protein
MSGNHFGRYETTKLEESAIRCARPNRGIRAGQSIRLDDSIPRTRMRRRSELTFRVKPRLTIVPVTGPADFPELICAISNIFLVDEDEMMLLEVREPFIPGDRSEAMHAWEIEPNAGAAICDMECGRTR